MSGVVVSDDDEGPYHAPVPALAALFCRSQRSPLGSQRSTRGSQHSRHIGNPTDNRVAAKGNRDDATGCVQIFSALGKGHSCLVTNDDSVVWSRAWRPSFGVLTEHPVALRIECIPMRTRLRQTMLSTGFNAAGRSVSARLEWPAR